MFSSSGTAWPSFIEAHFRSKISKETAFSWQLHKESQDSVVKPAAAVAAVETITLTLLLELEASDAAALPKIKRHGL